MAEGLFAIVEAVTDLSTSYIVTKAATPEQMAAVLSHVAGCIGRAFDLNLVDVGRACDALHALHLRRNEKLEESVSS